MAKLEIDIPEALMSELSQLALVNQLTIEKTVELAIKWYLEEVEEEDYRLSFERASSDPELIRMAEEGMIDYSDQLREI